MSAKGVARTTKQAENSLAPRSVLRESLGRRATFLAAAVWLLLLVPGALIAKGAASEFMP